MAEIAEEQMLEYLDGPRFLEWLEEEGIDWQATTESQRRRICDWKKGTRANIYTGTVDSLMTDNYLAISCIPDEVWSENQAHAASGHKNKKDMSWEARRERRADCELMLIQGDKTTKQIAEEVGVSKTAVGTWKRELRELGLIKD